MKCNTSTSIVWGRAVFFFFSGLVFGSVRYRREARTLFLFWESTSRRSEEGRRRWRCRGQGRRRTQEGRCTRQGAATVRQGSGRGDGSTQSGVVSTRVPDEGGVSKLQPTTRRHGLGTSWLAPAPHPRSGRKTRGNPGHASSASDLLTCTLTDVVRTKTQSAGASGTRGNWSRPREEGTTRPAPSHV